MVGWCLFGYDWISLFSFCARAREVVHLPPKTVIRFLFFCMAYSLLALPGLLFFFRSGRNPAKVSIVSEPVIFVLK